VDVDLSFTDGSSETDALVSFKELRQKVVEERYSQQISELKKAENDLQLKEQQYKHEDEARLKKLTAHNSFVEKLDVRKIQLMHFIEAQQQSVPSAVFEKSRSEGRLNEVCDGWQLPMYLSLPRTVSSASGRLLMSAKQKNVQENSTPCSTECHNSTNFTAEPVLYTSTQHYNKTGKSDWKAVPVQRTMFEHTLDLSAPWRLLSDDPGMRSRSASAPHLSDEASASLITNDTQFARSPSPHATQLSSISLMSVPESIYEDHEELAMYGRLSVSEVDVRHRQFSSIDNRNRWSLDEEHLSGQNTAASIRCVSGSNQDAVIIDSGLPSSPEAGHLDSFVSTDGNATTKQNVKASNQTGVLRSSGKTQPGILQKIGATLTSLAHRKNTKLASSKEQKPLLSSQSKLSHQQSDTGVVHDNCRTKVEVNANNGNKTTNEQSKNKSKQPLIATPKRYLSTCKGRIPCDAAERKNISASSVQDKPTMPAKVRESFRSFRKQLKLSAQNGLKRKSGDIPVEIFLPKPKVAEVDEDSRDSCEVGMQTCNIAADPCQRSEITSSQHMYGDIAWIGQWTDRCGVPREADEKERKIGNSCDDDGRFSDDSLNGEKTSSNCQAASLHYGHVIGPDNDGQFFLPYVQECVQPACSGDGSFSDDSLAEDVTSFHDDAEWDEQKPTSVFLPNNTCSVSPVAVACAASFECETRHDCTVNQSIVELESCSALYASDKAVYKQFRKTVILPSSDLQVTPVSRGLQAETFVAAHHLSDNSTSASAAG